MFSFHAINLRIQGMLISVSLNRASLPSELRQLPKLAADLEYKKFETHGQIEQLKKPRILD